MEGDPGAVRVEVYLPAPVLEWLDTQAQLRFQSRSAFIRGLVLAFYVHTVRAA